MLAARPRPQPIGTWYTLGSYHPPDIPRCTRNRSSSRLVSFGQRLLVDARDLYVSILLSCLRGFRFWGKLR